MGVSGKPDELLDIKSVLGDRIPVIRRFTGGGTVIVDHNTVFVTFICNKDAIAGVNPFPQSIMSWSSYIFQGTDFYPRENGKEPFGFFISLKDYMSRQVFIDKTIEAVETQFVTSSKQLEECEHFLTGNYRPTTRMLTEKELETAAGCDIKLKKVSDIIVPKGWHSG